MPKLLNINKIRNVIKNPRSVLKAPTLAYREIYRIAKKGNVWWATKKRADSGFDIMSEEWDTLLICDGARYDMFCEAAPPEWDIESVRSPATESWSYIQSVFVGREFHDTIYITSNPFAHKIPSDTFFHVENLLTDDWDEEHGTVLPSVVADCTREFRERYPNKRIIAHFMQPHFPFLGSTGERLPKHGISHTDGRAGGKDDTLHPWQQIRLWYDINDVIKAYCENHEIIIDVIKNLLRDLDESIAITADHGNLIGERGPLIPMKMYGHPCDLHMNKLIEVPWVVFEGEKINARTDTPLSLDQIDDETVDDRLESLGYK